MKIKLDENLGPSAAELFRVAGHDVCLRHKLWVIKRGRIREYEEAEPESG